MPAAIDNCHPSIPQTPKARGNLQTTRADFRQINRKVIEHAPCSVGILVDRGFGGAIHIWASNIAFSVVVLFFGGTDDHESLAYGMPMAEQKFSLRLCLELFYV
ncbi:Cation/H(+) antiporter 18 [Asimina triloba]